MTTQHNQNELYKSKKLWNNTNAKAEFAIIFHCKKNFDTEEGHLLVKIFQKFIYVTSYFVPSLHWYSYTTL